MIGVTNDELYPVPILGAILREVVEGVVEVQPVVVAGTPKLKDGWYITCWLSLA